MSSTDAREEIARRKGEHLRVAAQADVEAVQSAGWDDVRLVHEALPREDLAAIDLGTGFLGRRLAAPLLISAMTGGHPSAGEVNAVLARAAERHGVAMGVGSQRAALQNPSLSATYQVARESAPSATLIANVGAAQLVPQSGRPALGLEEVRRAVSMIRADALAIHLNFLEEAVQTEGDRCARGVREALSLAAGLGEVPVIAKETGAGFSRSTALELAGLGFRALDVGGLGGTSFAAVEGTRAEAHGDRRGARVGQVYREWGIPTAVSLLAARPAGLPLIATGGVRSGLDAAKALALGASLVGVARPLLAAALEGDAAVDEWVTGFLDELRMAVFLTGGRSVADLAEVPRAITGDTRSWLDDLGYG